MKVILILEVLIISFLHFGCSKKVEWGNWTWISGSNLTNQLGSYGELGVPSTANRPGARSGHSMAMDSNENLIYLFGGFQNPFGSFYLLNFHL